MALFGQWQKNGAQLDMSSRGSSKATKRAKANQQRHPARRNAKGSGIINCETLNEVLVLPEIRQVVKGNDMELLRGLLEENVKIEASRTEVFLYLNGGFAGKASVEREGKTRGAQLEILKFFARATRNTTCTPPTLKKRPKERPSKKTRQSNLLPLSSGTVGRKGVSHQRTPGCRRSIQRSRDDPSRCDQEKSKQQRPHTPGKASRKSKNQSTNNTSLSLATTAVPSSTSLTHQHCSKTNSRVQSHRYRRTEATGIEEPPPNYPAKPVSHTVLPGIASGPQPAVHQQRPPSALTVIQSSRVVPKKERGESAISYPSGSTQLGEIPAHKLAMPLRPPHIEPDTETVSEFHERPNQGAKGKFWKRWMCSTKERQ